MDLFKRMKDLSAVYDDDGPSSTVLESRPMFDKGGTAKLVSYVESLPKGSTVTSKMLEEYKNKNNLDVNLRNFFSRKAPDIKDKTFISDTRSKDFKLTSEEKANIEKYGQEKYDKLTDKSDKLRVRRGQDVGSLALEKQQKVKFKKEYDKAIKYYKSKGIEEPNMDSIRKNIARNDGKFNATGTKLQSESGLTGLFKNYEKTDLIADLKKGKNLAEISIEYFDKNEKQILKMLEGKRDYTKPLGRLSTDLSNVIKGDKEATKLYDKIKKTNSFNKLKNKSTYKKAVETLIPFAQEQGLIPNVNLKGKKINTASDYFNYAYKVKRDPVAKLFGFYERVGIEHPGGVARALIFDDPATLNEIVATMPDTNLAAGSTYDTYATGQARFFEKTKDPKYIKKINQIILNKQKEYGKPRTILDVDGDNVTRRTTKFSLTNPNLIEDSKSFINEYVAAGGSQRKNFNKLDPSLQQSILAFEEGDKIKGNKFLKTALKDTGAEADFKKITEAQSKGIAKKLADSGFECILSRKSGGTINCNDPRAYAQSIKQNMDKVQQGDDAAISRVNKLGKSMNAFKGAAKFTGWGLLTELGIAAPLAAIDYAKGANKDEIVSNATYGLFGKSEEEQLKEKYADYGKAQKFQDTYDNLLRAEDLSTQGGGYRTQAMNKLKAEDLEKKLIEQSKPFNTILPPSKGFKGDFDLDMFFNAQALDQKRREEFAKEKEMRSKERDILQPSTGLEAIELAGGGIAKMAGDRSGAMTTSMNPDSQGLSYLFNRVKKV